MILNIEFNDQNTSLATEGWRFNKAFLCESDEKYLFDVEVKLKLGNGYDIRLLLGMYADYASFTEFFNFFIFIFFEIIKILCKYLDLLADFPVEIILSRKSLLEFIFDTAASALTTPDRGYIYFIFILFHRSFFSLQNNK